jgi:hypothetical protein
LNSIGNLVQTIAMPAGIYFIEVRKDDGSRSTQKLVVY